VGTELWINKEALRSATGWSDRTIRWKVQLGALRSRNTSDRQKRGSGQREYALSSLPVEAQLKFLQQPLLSGPTAPLWPYARIQTNPTCLLLCQRLPSPSASTSPPGRMHRP